MISVYCVIRRRYLLSVLAIAFSLGCFSALGDETAENVRVLSARVIASLEAKPELPDRPPNVNINIRESGGAGASGSASDEPACPDEAACLIEVKSPQRLGSGVYVRFQGYSLLLTAAHVVNDLGDDSVITANGSEAKRVLIDRAADVAVLYTGEHKAVELAESDPAVGDIVDSWGRGEDGKMSSDTDAVASVLSSGGYQNQPCIETKTFPPLGRSGSGLFRNGRLVGVLHSRDNVTRRAQWSRIGTVQKVLGNVNLTGKRKVCFYSGESVYGDGWCPNCTAAKKKFGSGDSRVLLEYSRETSPTQPEEYPAARWRDVYGVFRYPTKKNADGSLRYHIVSSLDELVAYIDRNEPGYIIPLKE